MMMMLLTIGSNGGSGVGGLSWDTSNGWSISELLDGGEGWLHSVETQASLTGVANGWASGETESLTSVANSGASGETDSLTGVANSGASGESNWGSGGNWDTGLGCWSGIGDWSVNSNGWVDVRSVLGVELDWGNLWSTLGRLCVSYFT